MRKVVSKKDIEKEVLLEGDMSWSDKIKSLLPNFRYNVGGKNALNPFNRKAIRQIDADRKAEIERIMADSARDTLKRLDNEIKRIAPNFPNDDDSRKFIEAVEYIAFVYENVKAATQKNPPEMNVDAANKIIRGLSQYVKYFDEVKLVAKYSTVNEEIELDNESEVLDELFDNNAKNLRDKFRSATPQGAARQPETTKTQQLQSKRLPLTLALGGAILAAAGWVGQSQWFIDYIKGLKEISEDTFENTTEDVIERNIKVDPRGFSYTLQNNCNLNINLNFNQPIENLRKVLEFYGNGNLEDGVKITSNFIDPAQRAESVTNLLDQLKDPTNKIVGDVFNPAEETYGRADTLFSQFDGASAVFAKFIVRRIVTGVLKRLFATAGAALGSALIGIGPILVPLGISMVAAGALVFLARKKGLNDSRHATLETLYQMMREIPSTENNSSIEDSSAEENPQSNQLARREREPQQLGAGEEIETQRQIGGRPKPLELTGKKRSFSDKLGDYGQDTEFEPVDEKPPVNKPKPEPEGQPQGQRQLGAGQTETKPTGQEQPKSKKPYTQLNNSLRNFFKNLLDIRRQDQQNLQEEFEAVKGLRTPQNKVMIKNFIVSITKLRSLAKFINVLAKKDTKNQELNDLLQKIVQNKSHRTIIYISDLLEKSNTDMVNKFIEIYMQYIKSGRNNFKDLQSIIDSQLNEAENTKDAVMTSNTSRLNLKEFNEYFKIYLKDLYQLFTLINKLRNTEQKTTTKPATKPKAANSPKNMPDQQYANIGQLEEAKKKKTPKYSKKASEFIGKEISHLKKDKGYPQDRAVAAAINVAKEKGMKVGTKKK